MGLPMGNQLVERRRSSRRKQLLAERLVAEYLRQLAACMAKPFLFLGLS